jgi:PAS domain-containing protein
LWTDDRLQQLKILAEIFANALKRKHATYALLISNAELKKSEIVLRGSEERFRLVADTAPALIWMTGTNNLCTFFNQGWLSFTGRSMDQELGEGCYTMT